MRAPILALLLLGAGPALAQDNLNVEQPSRAITQSGQTTAGPIATSPFAGGATDLADGPPPVVVDGPPVVLERAPLPPGVVVVPVR